MGPTLNKIIIKKTKQKDKKNKKSKRLVSNRDGEGVFYFFNFYFLSLLFSIY